MSIWIINGRCEDCVGAEIDDEIRCSDTGCDCWCHDQGESDEVEDWWANE